jgi:hypothetical protein
VEAGIGFLVKVGLEKPCNYPPNTRTWGNYCAIRSSVIRDNNQLEKGPRGKISLAWTFVIS